jgi:iduronate 2-sulfatase
MKRTFALDFWFAALLLLTGTAFHAGAAGATAKPNILFIAVDDLRPELGCYGNPIVKSPNIDALAKRGVVFDRAYCQQAVCSPSRSSLLTGARPDTTKVWNLTTHIRKALPEVVTLPQLFKNHGYFAQAMGKVYHHGYDDAASWSVPTSYPKAQHGSELLPIDPDGPKSGTRRGPPFASPDVPDNALHDGELGDMAVAALRVMKIKSQPFFLAVGFIKPHLPFVSPRKYWDLYDPAKISLAPNPFPPIGAPAYAVLPGGELRSYAGVPPGRHLPDDYARQLKHGYFAAVSYMDAQVGRVVAELDRLGLRDNTIIILWSDHGWKLGEHGAWAKHSNVENDTRAPLLISVPGMANAGKHTEALVEFVDIYPTLAELAGLSLPHHLEGSSFKPVLENVQRPWKRAAFSQYPRKVGKQNLMGYTMRTDCYRFTRWVDRTDPTKVAAEELYDHRVDPQENTNLLAKLTDKVLVAELTAQWTAGWKAAGPEGAELPAKTNSSRARPARSEGFWATENTQTVRIPQTLTNVPYGSHNNQVLDFWKARSDGPTPVLFFIHGGGWRGNDKDRVAGVSNYLAAGVSVVSINYRFVQEAQAAGVKPPVKWPLEDAARALQFVRSKATEWNLDKTRIGASGGSAGACSSLWLAFHDDLAEPGSSDPISRESTRLLCAGVVGAQTTLDPKQMREWTPNSVYGGHAFGFAGDRAKKVSAFEQFLENRDRIMPWIKEYSPFDLVSADDPPVYLYYSAPPALGQKQKDPTHTANFGVKLEEKTRSLGVECHLMYPGAPEATYLDPVQFLIAKLKAPKASTVK